MYLISTCLLLCSKNKSQSLKSFGILIANLLLLPSLRNIKGTFTPNIQKNSNVIRETVLVPDILKSTKTKQLYLTFSDQNSMSSSLKFI